MTRKNTVVLGSGPERGRFEATIKKMHTFTRLQSPRAWHRLWEFETSIFFARDFDAVSILSEMFVIARGTRGQSLPYLKFWLPVAEKIYGMFLAYT